MIQHLIGEAQGVHSPSVSSRVAACYRLLLLPVLILDWYLISMIIVVTTIPRRSTSSGPIDGSGRTGLFCPGALVNCVRYQWLLYRGHEVVCPVKWSYYSLAEWEL